MKRKISLFLIILIVLSMNLSVFADTTLSSTTVFKGYSDDGNIYTYIFSKISDFTDDIVDFGIKIKDRWFSVIKGDDITQFDKAKSSGAFGIGIKDENRVLGDVYTASPMALDSLGNIVAKGESVEISQDMELTDVVFNDATIKNVIIGGVEIPGISPDIYKYNFSSNELLLELESNIDVQVIMNDVKGATYSVKQEFFQRDILRASTFKISTLSEDGLDKKEYVIHINDDGLLPVSDDSSTYDEINSNHQGTRDLLYAISDEEVYALLKFDLSGIEMPRIRNAVLSVASYKEDADEFVFYKADGTDWDEDTMVKATAPTIYTDKIIGTAYNPGEKPYTCLIDVTSYMKECISNGQQYMNIAISNTGEYDTVTRFTSKESVAFSGVNQHNTILMDLRRKEVDKISYETIKAPTQRVLSDKINVTLNGEYFYFVNSPYIAQDNSIMVKLSDLARLLDMEYREYKGIITMKSKDLYIAFEVGNDEIVVDESIFTLSLPVTENEFVSLSDFAKFTGISYSFDENTMMLKVIK